MRSGPARSQGELRALIHAANVARDAGLASVPDEETAGHLRLFRHGVAVGLSEVPRVPGGNKKQPPARCLLECLKDREDDVLRFLADTAIPPTNNQAERDARPAKTGQEAIRAAPLGENHPPPVRHPRLRIHRHQARTRRLRRHPRRPRREPLDTTHPGQHLNCTRNPSRKATRM